MKVNLDNLDDFLGIVSSLFTIYATIAGMDAMAGGTIGVEANSTCYDQEQTYPTRLVKVP